MPRKNPVDPHEKEVGRRLRQVRSDSMLTGTAFAVKHGISPGNLSKYENGWVPLPWQVADRICVRENISQQWLATGKGKKKLFLLFDSDLVALIPRNATLCEAYRDTLAPRLEKSEKEYLKTDPKGNPWGFAGWFNAETYLREISLAGDLRPLFQHLLDSWYEKLPPGKRRDLIKEVMQTLLRYLEKNGTPDLDVKKTTRGFLAVFFEDHERGLQPEVGAESLKRSKRKSHQ